MLATQVSYWANVENARHNRATEWQNQQQVNELVRHNTVTESQNASSISENIRHNKMTERYSLFNWAENRRHNQEMESQGWTSVSANAAASYANAALSNATASLRQQESDMYMYNNAVNNYSSVANASKSPWQVGAGLIGGLAPVAAITANAKGNMSVQDSMLYYSNLNW